MRESNARSETSETEGQQATGDTNGRDDVLLDGFRKLLESENPGESHEDEGEGESPNDTPTQGGKAKAKPKAFKELAERLELTPEDLYAIEVPLAEGRTMTIGKMKDAAAIQDQLAVREMQFAERVGKQEAEWTRSQAEFSQLVSMIDPKALTPEMRKKAAEAVTANNARERTETMRLIPEWSNQELRETELQGMVELLKDYGIGESFLTAQMSSKLMRFVRDSYLRKVRIERALAAVKVVKKPSTTGKSGGSNKAPARSVPASPRGRSGVQETFRNTLSKG